MLARSPFTHSMAEQTTFDQHGASYFVDLALSRIPSAFGKLAFVASLRQANPGCYHDPLAALVYGKEQVDATLRQKHREMFHAFLGAALATQTEQVAEYLARADDEKPRIAQTVRRWFQESLYEELIPATVRESEGELFSSDLRTILQLLQARLGFADEAGGR